MVAQHRAQNKRELSVVGIDQALRNVGFCINNVASQQLTATVFKEHKLRGAERLSSLRRCIIAFIREFGPVLVALEGYAYDATNRLADLGEIGGILRVELFDLGIPHIIVPPTTLKQFVTGSGAASKEKMMYFVKERYRYLTDNDNIADAIGLAKFAEVYTTEHSRYRSELEVVKNFMREKTKVHMKFKKAVGL